MSNIMHFPNTTLKKETTPKSLNKGDLALVLNLSLFLPSNPTNKKVRLYATLAQNGTISIQRMFMTALKDNYSTTNTSRPLFVAHSMDSREYTSSNGRTLHGDGNRQIVDYLLADDSVWNSLSLTGKVASLLIPTSKEWDNEKHNEHVYTLISKLEKIQSTQATESVLKEAYTKTWNEYLEKEGALLEQGLLAPNNVIIANQNSIQPTISTALDVRYKNDKLTGSKLLEGDISYLPCLNNVNGSLILSNDTVENFTLGEYTANNGTKLFSTTAKPFDFLNQETTESLIISVADLPYQTQRSRAENFETFCQDNQAVTLKNAVLNLRARPGYLTVFQLSGDSMSYTAKELQLDFYKDIDLESPDEVVSSDDDF